MFEILLYHTPQDYETIYSKQIQHREKVQNHPEYECLFLLEHKPVFTTGRQFQQQHLLISTETCTQRGVQFTHTDRGGDITYHGPGQLVGYPILNLTARGITVHQYIRKLEETIIETLASYQITAQPIKSLTGVWIQDRKISAIGIGVKNGITWHGFSINIDIDLTPFQWIIPCGISDKKVTSLKNELPPHLPCPSVHQFIYTLLPIFTNHFQIPNFSLTQIP